MNLSKVNLMILGLLGACVTAHAFPCGRVPVYCIVETKLDAGNSTVYSYSVEPDKIDCAPTTYLMGQASPICQLTSHDMGPYYKMCVSKYSNSKQRVVGVSYFKGGDPANPANGSDVRMFGQFYKTFQLYATDMHYETTPYLSPRAGCDIITD